MKKTFILLLLLFITVHAVDGITPIPLQIHYDTNKAKLGKKLFFDPHLSKDGAISCSTCHTLPGSGANTTPFSYGVNGAEGIINSPTVLNSVYNFVQFWDGRAKSLREQISGPIENPLEMANSMDAVVQTLKNNLVYKKEFEALYKEGITAQNITDALAEFESALTTPNSRFDKYLLGDKQILNKEEKEGYKRFVALGCISCHDGVNIGGNMYQKAGIMSDFVSKNSSLGRYNVTGREADKYVFKVPTLRNIEMTAPYFHDGATETLKEAVRKMGEHQLGRILGDQDIDNLVAFLKTLTGQTPEILKELP